MKTFRIQKRSGTYAELLEAYGVANLLHKIVDSMDIDNAISITSNEQVYEVSLKEDISEDVLKTIVYFPPFKYVKQKIDTKVESYPDYYDYPRLKEAKNDLDKIHKDYKGTENKKKRDQEIAKVEQHHPSIWKLNVMKQIAVNNNFASFNKLYQSLFVNKENFPLFVSEILKYYTETDYDSREFDKKIKSLQFDKKVTATQLYNPSQGKGIKAPKADGLNGKNVKSSWISETMKISGALSDMVCKLVKVGKSYDLKVFVPEYKEVKYTFKAELIPEFEKYLKGNTPIKIDILYTLLLTRLIIEHQTEERRVRVRNIVSGLHSVYQKDLGQTRAVINIGFLQIPGFIEIGSKEENAEWIDILKEQRLIIGGIKDIGQDRREKESGKTIPGLLLYRNFLSGDDIYSFFKFAHWYSTYAFTELADNKTKPTDNKKVRVFSIESLNKLYKSMDTKELNLSEIITNSGFQAVAEAIRRSTVSLQYQQKKDRIYNIRYGVSQTLETKSKSKDDLAKFVGEFIARYNAETARVAEKTAAHLAVEYAKATTKKDAVKKAKEEYTAKRRKDVSADDLAKFYPLLDKFPSRLIGALLASYGFALPAAEASSNDNILEKEEEDEDVVDDDQEDEESDN
ncbi:MAG: hypothetical protein LBQ31_01000 [Bacteroidales bacterium]|jgi:hypothetical protein|nr:hypothetical protein [Bacteroidales bacterium]